LVSKQDVEAVEGVEAVAQVRGFKKEWVALTLSDEILDIFEQDGLR